MGGVSNEREISLVSGENVLKALKEEGLEAAGIDVVDEREATLKQALEKRSLMKDFYNRPPYQQNDYIGWIERAKRQETKVKRLSQMLDELEAGGVYMKMNHPASSKS